MDQTTQTSQPIPPAPNNGKGLGIAGLIVGIIALLFSFIPCLGMYGIIPAIVGIILSAISMKQSGRAGQPKGMAIGGLVCGIIAAAIAIYWIYVTYYVVHNSSDAMLKISEEFEKNGVMDSLNKAMEQLKEITDTTQNR
jgi:hypothetical protein